MADQQKVIVFSYGSNLSSERLGARTPSARFLATGQLHEHVRRWHKRSVDGSGKCDAYFTAVATDVLWGALFEMPVEEKRLLDHYEGLGIGYEQKRVEVRTATGSVRAWTNCATDIDASLAPYHWYKRYVLIGAREHGLPTEHVEEIERVEAWLDPDPQRVATNGGGPIG